MPTAPPTCRGATAVIVVPLMILIELAVDGPKLTLAPVKKFVPVMVTAVAPELGPVAGEMPVTVRLRWSVRPRR